VGIVPGCKSAQEARGQEPGLLSDQEVAGRREGDRIETHRD
jgi:hypothetical protein